MVGGLRCVVTRQVRSKSVKGLRRCGGGVENGPSPLLWPVCLIQQLVLRYHRTSRDWITTQIGRKQVCVKTEHISITETSNRSRFTSGRGLSPTLWSAVADSLLKWLSKQGVFAQGYADDGLTAYSS